MSKGGCAGCLVKSMTIMAQRMKIAQQRREIDRLKRIIHEARQTAGVIQSEADQVMSLHRPRPVWAYAKGAQAAAARIAHRLVG